jgi:(1->4)-alpha-D-glucan 1-alpha-D-glucosylmutase
MLASSTHDTKRSEDVRARLALLSEIPDKWRAEVLAWRDDKAHRRPAIDANTEYLLYQTLVGAWPIELDRLWAYLEKAVREQKVHTTWTDPNEEYEGALRAFADELLADAHFTARVGAFVASLEPAWHVSALAQTLLKLTAPGVPDIYQGTEIWDLSLVDPDNRRPVDYQLRRRLLERARNACADEVLADASEGLAKIWLINRVLALRAQRPELFAKAGTYRAIASDGSRAEHVVAFVRSDEAVVVTPRLVARLGWPEPAWEDTAIELPAGRWRDQLTDRVVDGGRVFIDNLLSGFPMALLVAEAD